MSEIEIITVLRRVYSKGHNLGSNWIVPKELLSKELLKECNILMIDQDIRKIIEEKKEISDCRTLDAIHVASVYFMANHLGLKNVRLYSLDKRVTEVASRINIKIDI
ncbi:MAG: PIN domain-containing protein [Leptospiraceae bacterium]|nr:PIN domain-containing protein [Leptospiraceae bacterium]MCP5494582.1 PIN domain-containing protein [Leptospiraceae bacterium]